MANRKPRAILEHVDASKVTPTRSRLNAVKLLSKVKEHSYTKHGVGVRGTIGAIKRKKKGLPPIKIKWRAGIIRNSKKRLHAGAKIDVKF